MSCSSRVKELLLHAPDNTESRQLIITSFLFHLFHDYFSFNIIQISHTDVIDETGSLATLRRQLVNSAAAAAGKQVNKRRSTRGRKKEERKK